MAAIVFDHISKRFKMHHERHVGFGQRIAGLLRRRPSLDDDTFWALRDVSFTMQPGETIGLIGHNGSGKSTTMKLITRILEPTSGTVAVNGRISALLELGSGFHPDLSGRENIYLNGSLLGQSHADMRRKMDEIIDFSEIEPFIDTPVKHYSSGMYMRLAFAIAISVDPDILLTDEVLAVGDDAFQRKCIDRIYQFKQDGRTILFVSHALGVVQNLCNRVLWFDHGILKEDGDPLAVIDCYLKASNELNRKRLEQERQRVAAQHGGTADSGESDPDRWGTREVELVRVDLLDRSGAESAVFETGGTLTARLYYRARQRIEQPVFGIGIHHQNNIHISGPNTRFSNYPIDAVEGDGFVDYTITDLPLMEGEYRLSAVVYDYSMSHPYDHHEKKYPFYVHATTVKERYGLFTIPCTWHWQPGGGAAA